jgi:UDP-N-acetylmuramoyl-L-alanyl-D-glutamate--2,6-diaminopimelate ligase
VFGCGGERDASKRAPMGAAAAAGAQRVIVTSDNPRGEPPQSIIDQVLAGVPAHALGHTVRAVIDRRAAIAEAVAAAEARDVVLVAGKGHETTQEIAGEKRPFSDAEEAMGALRLRAAAQDGSPASSARPVSLRAFTREAQP